MISFPEDLVLEDERTLLRPLELTDLEYLLPFALGEPETWKYSNTSPAGREGMERYLNDTISGRAGKKEYPFIVFDKAKNAWAGSTRFYDIQPANLTSQLGFTWYGKDFRRTGLNRHCKWLMLSYAFEQWGLERVEFRADLRNEPSVNAMKAIGCIVEGVLRSHSVMDSGIRRDTVVLSILKSEWFGGVKTRLQAMCRV
ncbi:MAG: GNAT family protein [Puia sp.]|nr:GNAT family protein [Puia sp.]